MMRTRILGVALLAALTVTTAMAHAAGTAPVPAHKPAPPQLQIFMPGDDVLDCAGIRQHIASMEEMIVSSDQEQRAAQNTGTGISIAKAIGGFLIGSIPGAIGVMAAGHVASEAAEGKADVAEAREDIAGQRRSMMIGMYNAKGCTGPIHSGRAVRNAAIPEDWNGNARAGGSQAGYGQPENVNRFDPAAIEPAAGGRGYKVEAHKVEYND